jgi:23S rRNA pseudouridine955/2504/2580 synthase
MNELSKARATVLEVDEDGVAQRIDNYLLRRLKGVPKSHVYRVVRSGEVRVNSARVRPDHRLQLGDRVRVPPVRLATATRRVQTTPPRGLPLPVIFEDPALLVIDKPTGLAVHGGSGVSFGVIESLRAAHPRAKLLELAHRLDRDTSGLLLIAKKRSALVELHRMLREGEIKKVYLALVKGQWQGGAREIRAPLQKFVSTGGERRVAVRPHGVAAITRARPLAVSPTLSLLELQLLTGRTHQIRVHLAHIGHPVVGDDKYGDFAFNREMARRNAKRLCLHAWRLELAHPLGGAALRLESPVPADVQAVIDTAFEGEGEGEGDG